MIYWWGWTLIFFVFVIIFFGMLVWFLFALYIRYTSAHPAIEGIFINDEGKAERERLSNTGLFTTEWKLKSFNNNLVRFKVLPKGIGKSIVMEWDESDYLEFEFVNGKKFVLFGLKNFNNRFSLQLKFLKSLLNNKIAECAILKQKLNKLENKQDEIIEKRMKQSKEALVFFPSSKGGIKK